MARRKNSNRRRRRGGFGFLYKLLSTLVICGAIVVALTLFFRVDTIVVTGNVRYTQEEIVSATGIQTGDNLSLLNKRDVAQKLQQKLPYIELPRINRKYPDTLLVEVTECSFTLAVVQDGSVWYLSPGGKIVEQEAAPLKRKAPRIDGCKLLAPSVGTPIALATEYASQQASLLSLLKALDEAELLEQVEAIHLKDISVLTMDFGGRFTVELPYDADYAYKLRALQTVIGKLESNETGTICLTRDDGRVNFIRK